MVLAARTAARLDDVAKEVDALGRRGLAVPTDLADAAAAEHLAEAALDAFGRVDALVYNALAMPPIKDLGDVEPGGARAELRRERRRRAAADQAVHAAAGGELGLGGDDQLHGGAPLPAHDGAVQARPRRPCWRWRRAWPPSSARAGIRVNSVAPGHIWADSLKWYFGYLAHKRGVEAAGDLRRDRGGDRPAPAARAGRDRGRGGVPGLAAGPGDHRAVPGRQLRRVPPLSRRRSATSAHR